jgi:hypothetical protein
MSTVDAIIIILSYLNTGHIRNEEEFKRALNIAITTMTDKANISERLYKAFIYDMWDADTTPDDVENDIKENPREVIRFLLDYIENT